MLRIYTDGSCIGNPGPGGWAAIILEANSKKALHGREDNTTNNRMELTAVIKGLDAIPIGADVTVFSDSKYLINSMTHNWKRKANGDLWQILDAHTHNRTVQWKWVRGHDGDPLNEEADSLANRAARAGKLMTATPESASLTHIDESGKATMVDVGWKPDTDRVALATGSVLMKPKTLALIKSHDFEKGDVIGVARVAGVMAAKQTPQLIPLCHSLPLHQVTLEFDIDDVRSAVNITATAKTTGKTGVEMEALTAVSVAALTIYDMCKAVDRAMHIEGIRMVSKHGGKSDGM